MFAQICHLKRPVIIACNNLKLYAKPETSNIKRGLFLSAFKRDQQQPVLKETILDNAVQLQSKPPIPDKLYKLIEVEVRGNDPEVLKSYAWYATTAAQHLGIEVGRNWTPEKAHHERYTLLRSIHVNKKCRVQYEFRTYFRFMQFHRLTGSTADTFLEYIQRNLPEGVAMKTTKVALEIIPDHIKVPEKDEHQMEALS